MSYIEIRNFPYKEEFNTVKKSYRRIKIPCFIKTIKYFLSKKNPNNVYL